MDVNVSKTFVWKTCPLHLSHSIMFYFYEKSQTTEDQPESRAGGLQREAHSSSCVYIWNSQIQQNPQLVLICISEHYCWETGSLPCSCRSINTGHHDVLWLHHLLSLSEVTDTSEKLPTTLQQSILEGTRAKCLLCTHWYPFT